jgi:hypothetical protein
MFKNSPALWLVSLCSLSGIAAAQTPAPVSAMPEIAKPAALPYRSAFEGYKPYTDDKLLSWKEVNDNTGRIGGWRVYAREARQADDKAPAHDMSQMPEPKTGGGKP